MTNETLIEKYFTAGLTPEEQALFNSRLTQDPEFAARFELEKDLRAVLIDKGKEDLKTQFQILEDQRYNSDSTIEKSSFLKYAVAACIIIGTTLLAVNFFKPSLSNEELFAQNFQPYSNIIAPVERGETPDDLLGKSFALYEQGNYEEAQRKFQELYDASGDRYLLFYRANALLALDRSADAIEVFKSHQETTDNFLGKSKWYLALSYLKNNDSQKAIELLKEIKQTKTYNHERVDAIVDELE
ncbi:tetratricopeptide repeat protein [Dokdonia sinensis]|uniref:Tetratricopeptide repeat protein n=1 Tax=Dokdonia sinensis TaxID=2479847 RepID=A0A3M0FZ61_9FLAO|nr:tetratricopeptide repeat protein [Dokdonia sinensis]RMB58021.1 tetratricopeptide repeat protein [Dokdonia sinensis]